MASVFTNSFLKTILDLPPTIQKQVFALADSLGTQVHKHPERVSNNRKKKVSVYRHPDPPVEITYEIDKRTQQLRCLHVGETTITPRVKIFVSYSHKDVFWLNEFKPYIQSLDDQGKIKFWHDGMIEPGTDWEDALHEALHSAKAAVLLVSQDFLASDYIKNKELPVLQERQKAGSVQVEWIHLRYCLYEKFWFARNQALANPKSPLADLRKSKRDEQLTNISRKLEKKLKHLSD